MLFVPFLEKMQAEHGLKYTIVTWDRPGKGNPKYSFAQICNKKKHELLFPCTFLGYFGSKPPRRMETDFNFAKDVELCKILLDVRVAK